MYIIVNVWSYKFHTFAARLLEMINVIFILYSETERMSKEGSVCSIVLSNAYRTAEDHKNHIVE
jgi:hypothetical protein